MKRKLITLLLLFASVSLAFVSCDKNNDEGTDHAATIAGKYSGNLTITDMPFEKDIDLQRSATNKVKVVLTDFAFGDLNLGDIVVDKIPVTEKDGKYTLEKTTATVTLTIVIPIPIPVTVSGTVSGNKLNLTISVASEELGVDMDVYFEGTKK